MTVVPIRDNAEIASAASLLLDTHVLVWLMFGDKKLGVQATGVIRRGCEEERVVVSAITPWEIGLLVSKNRIELYCDAQAWMQATLSTPGVRLLPLLPEIAVMSSNLPWEMHPDPADRILVATARKFGATLVTADQALLAMGASGKFRVLDATL